jgi:hypothetical protein
MKNQTWALIELPPGKKPIEAANGCIKSSAKQMGHLTSIRQD